MCSLWMYFNINEFITETVHCLYESLFDLMKYVI